MNNTNPKWFAWPRRLSRALDRLVYKDEEEALENPQIPLETRFSFVQDLNHLNRRSGYTRIFLWELERLVTSFLSKNQPPIEPLKILDVGAGGGGLLQALWHWAKRKKIPVKLTGIDLSEYFVKRTQLELASKGVEASLVHADACFLDCFEENSFDFVVSSYVVHHLRHVEKVALFFSEIHRVAREGWLVVDLDRRFYAPVFVKLAGHLFRAPSTLISDGVKSARRAYRVSEMNSILDQIRKTKNRSGMNCTPFPIFPYWMIKGRKQADYGPSVRI